MLLSSLWLSLLLYHTSAGIETRPTTHHTAVLRLRCDSLLYRTVFYNSSCYFVIDAETNSSTTSSSCSRVLPGAKVVGEAPDAVWNAVEFPKNEFVRDSDSAGKRRAMCLFESRSPKAVANSTTTQTGKCKRVNICGDGKPKLTYVLPLPFIAKLKERIEPGQTFIFRGRTYAHADAWNIAFHCKEAVWTYGNDAAIQISFNYQSDNRAGRVYFYTFRNNVFGHMESVRMPDSLKNKAFEFRIRATEDSLQMFINNKEFATYKLRLPMSSITRISTASHIGQWWRGFTFLDFEHPHGGFSDVSFESISLGEKYDPIPKESGITTTGFSYCKTLFITGKIETYVSRPQINFLRNNETKSNGVQNALLFIPCYDRGLLALNDNRNGVWGTEQRMPLPFARGVSFSLTITNEPHGFVLLHDGKHLATFVHRVCPIDITTIWIGQISDLTVTVSHAADCDAKGTAHICG